MKLPHPRVVRTWGILAVLTLAVLATPALAQFAQIDRLAASHSWLPWPEEQVTDHPLEQVVTSVLTGEHGEQPDWKLPMLVNGLRKQPEQCTITAYCSRCCDGGGRYTRWGSPVRRGICAADPDYWGPGSVVWIGPPVNEVLIVEDTGGAIQGPHRFDVCMEGAHYMCREIGYSETVYVPLHRVPPKARWGQKPQGWHPPVWCTPSDPDGGS
ncbi:MAG: 3D domain-containing protein [Armatimonadota bacterium]